MALTNEEIAELQRLEREDAEWSGSIWEAEAGPGPDGDEADDWWIHTPEPAPGKSFSCVATKMGPESARLAAAARNALPSLLSEVLASRSSPQPASSPGGLDLAFLSRLLASEPDVPFKPGRIEMDRATVEKLIAAASPQGERERALEEAPRKAKLELEFRYAQIEDCEGALTPEGWRDYQARRTARATASSPHYAEKGD